MESHYSTTATEMEYCGFPVDIGMANPMFGTRAECSPWFSYPSQSPKGGSSQSLSAETLPPDGGVSPREKPCAEPH